ncbi:hypothetical protein R50073_36400 [Maricurvus nonylphenolicus]|uniref:substrate-binding periplasmic protein n=1 Tax=Maricurvus nonylphenolicus TaxID=1008307 RepID=UPI0036F2D76D
MRLTYPLINAECKHLHIWLCMMLLTSLFCQIPLGYSSQPLKPLKFAFTINGLPPFYYIDSKNQFRGISTDLLDEFLHTQGYTLAYKIQPRLRQPEQFRSGELDIAFLNPRWLPSNTPVVFSDPFIHYREVFFAPSSAPDLSPSIFDTQTYNWLYGKTLCTHIGYTYSDILEQLFKSRDVIRYDSPSEERMIKMLSAKRCDYMLGNLMTTRWLAKNLNLSGRIKQLPAIDGNWEVMVVLHNKYAHLIAPLNAYLASPAFTERRKSIIEAYLTPQPKDPDKRAPFTLNVPMEKE